MPTVMGAVRNLVGLLLVAGASATFGAAASLAVSSDRLGAATVGTPRCTSAGLTVYQALSGSAVSSVTVGGIPAACGGGTLLVTVSNGTASGTGSAAIPAAGGSVTVGLGTAPTAATDEETDIVMVGP